MKTRFKPLLCASAMLLMAVPALAHDGHGLTGFSHWHATDTLGFVGAGIALVVAIWFSRGGKP